MKVEITKKKSKSVSEHSKNYRDEIIKRLGKGVKQDEHS